jgi:hypothetical protein
MDSNRAREVVLAARKPAVLVAFALAWIAPTVASAHLAYYTGEDSYYCTLARVGASGDTCWYDGDSSGTFNFSSKVVHSYAFQSSKNETTDTGRTVCTTIVRPSNGDVDTNCGVDFKRNCWYLWQHTGDPLDCHDQDDVTLYVAISHGDTNSSMVVGGHPLW